MRSLLLLITLSLFSVAGFAQKDFYTTRWSSVYRYEVQQLPKSALAVVDSIYTRAKKENNFTQVTRALIYQSKFAITLEENSELKIIQKFKKEINGSKAPIRNILEAFTADIYWQYFQINRYKIYQRTRTTGKVDSTDFRTWDIATLFQEIDEHHSRSLENTTILKQSKLAPFDELLIRADNSRRFRPTLFDLLAHHALDFYRANESAIARPVDGFNIDDEKYIFDFENLKLPDHDTLSGQVKALIIYQQLLAFHKRDRDQATYIDVELERLDYVIDAGSFDNKFDLQKKALTALQARYRELPISTNIDFALATLLRDQARDNENFSMKEAVEVCQYAIRRYPMSDGGLKCKILLEGILDPSLELTLEDYIPSARSSKFQVRYKNVDSLQLRVYRITKDRRAYFYLRLDDEQRVAFLDSLKPAQQWSVRLRNSGDYKEHSTEVVVPPLERGLYLVRANIADGDQARKARLFIHDNFEVTDLVVIKTTFDLEERFQVVNRTTGAPVVGADLHLKNRTSTTRGDSIDTHLTTGTNGFATLNKKGKDWYNVDITVTFRDDHLYLNEYFIGEGQPEANDDEDNDISARSFVFTDRSIYRPGQTVYFKGILVQTKARKTSIVTGEWVEVSMEDVNGQEVETKRLKTNSFGSFSGEFKLPAGGLTGSYSINSLNPPIKIIPIDKSFSKG